MSENLIYCVRDVDVGYESVIDQSPLSTRIGARGIVFNEDGKIAVFNKQVKNEYKLPGGGVDKGEIIEKAFIRECREEIGCSVEIIEKLGIIIEEKSRGNFRQTSHVFVSKKVGEEETPNPTEKERKEGAQYI